MFLSELKRVLKDPFMQGAIFGIGTYCVLLIVVQKSLSPNVSLDFPNMALTLSRDQRIALFEGKPLYFVSNLGELVLTKVT